LLLQRELAVYSTKETAIRKTRMAPTKEPINHFFIIVDFGLRIKGRNLFYVLQVELLTGF
jgi:hypothetical protein